MDRDLLGSPLSVAIAELTRLTGRLPADDFAHHFGPLAPEVTLRAGVLPPVSMGGPRFVYIDRTRCQPLLATVVGAIPDVELVNTHRRGGVDVVREVVDRMLSALAERAVKLCRQKAKRYGKALADVTLLNSPTTFHHERMESHRTLRIYATALLAAQVRYTRPPVTPGELALHRAVAANLDDNMALLQLADLYEERNDPRAKHCLTLSKRKLTGGDYYFQAMRMGGNAVMIPPLHAADVSLAILDRMMQQEYDEESPNAYLQDDDG